METGKLMDEIALILQTSKVGTRSTSANGTDSEYMTFYIKDYAPYAETEKNSRIMRCIGQNSFVRVILGGGGERGWQLEIAGEAEGCGAEGEVGGDQGIAFLSSQFLLKEETSQPHARHGITNCFNLRGLARLTISGAVFLEYLYLH